MDDASPAATAQAACARALLLAYGHEMRDSALMTRACTHASRVDPQAPAVERTALANERLEFLGDALLAAAIAEWVCEKFPQADEGHLSRLKSRLASRSALAEAFDRHGLAPTARLGAAMGPVESLPASVKANLAEAQLAAVYLDGGWSALTRAVRQFLAAAIEAPDAAGADPCMRLQAWALAQHQTMPVYSSERSGGSDHAPIFSARVVVHARQGQGTDTSRKRAHAAAAQDLLQQLNGAELSTVAMPQSDPAPLK